ncbi:MAG: hypothetical protein IT195_01240 [Microthrixaceae bacterium]|nr:hypothetical protein [Microthrixaceae bacterium]
MPMTEVDTYNGGFGGVTMSIPGEHHSPAGETLEESRTKVLATAPLFPGYDEMVIDGLTDDEEAEFLAALAEA